MADLEGFARRRGGNDLKPGPVQQTFVAIQECFLVIEEEYLFHMQSGPRYSALDFSSSAVLVMVKKLKTLTSQVEYPRQPNRSLRLLLHSVIQ